MSDGTEIRPKRTGHHGYIMARKSGDSSDQWAMCTNAQKEPETYDIASSVGADEADKDSMFGTECDYEVVDPTTLSETTSVAFDYTEDGNENLEATGTDGDTQLGNPNLEPQSL